MKDEYYMTPEEAQQEITRITGDMNHPYWDDKAPINKRNLAVEYVNRLYAIVNGIEYSIEGYVEEYQKSKEESMKDTFQDSDPLGKSSRSSAYGKRASHNDNLTDDERHQMKEDGTYDSHDPDDQSIGWGEKETSSGYLGKIEDYDGYQYDDIEDEEEI